VCVWCWCCHVYCCPDYHLIDKDYLRPLTLSHTQFLRLLPSSGSGHLQLQAPLLETPYFFSGVPLMECCCVDDTSSENTIVGLPPSWVDTDVCWLYIGINPPQPGGTRAPSRSPPVSWWSEWHTDSSMMILPGIWACHVAKEAEPSCFNDSWNWRAAGSLPDRSVGNLSSIWDPKDFLGNQTPYYFLTFGTLQTLLLLNVILGRVFLACILMRSNLCFHVYIF